MSSEVLIGGHIYSIYCRFEMISQEAESFRGGRGVGVRSYRLGDSHRWRHRCRDGHMACTRIQVHRHLHQNRHRCMHSQGTPSLFRQIKPNPPGHSWLRKKCEGVCRCGHLRLARRSLPHSSTLLLVKVSLTNQDAPSLLRVLCIEGTVSSGCQL